MRIITPLGSILFLVSMGVSIVFLLRIESVFNGGFHDTVKALWLPVGLLVFGFTWLFGSRWQEWIIAAFLYPTLLLMSWPYVMVANALTSTGETVTYNGAITDMWITASRFPSYQIVFLDQETQEEVILPVSRLDYDELSLGDRVQSTFSVGGLGIPFRWRQFADSRTP